MGTKNNLGERTGLIVRKKDMKKGKAYNISGLSDEKLEEVKKIFSDEEGDNFLNLFDDNGEPSSGNTLLLLTSEVEGNTKKFLDENARILDVVVFDDIEKAREQAADGGLCTFFYARREFIVAI